MSPDWRPAESDLIGVVYREAHLLDRQAYQEWYDLFAEDGRYWVPLGPEQSDPDAEQSLAFEDKLLLSVRIERLRNPRTYAQQPSVRGQHVLQAPQIEEADHVANRYRLRTAFLYTEVRRDDQLMLTGTVEHCLRVVDRTLRIVQKRVDLLNARSLLPGIFLMP